MIGIIKRSSKMPRKNINMSSAQLASFRQSKANFMIARKISNLSDVEFMLTMARAFDYNYEMKKGK